MRSLMECTVALLVLLAGSVAVSGDVLMNAGAASVALRVTFSEAVTLKAVGGAFLSVEPTGPATTFVLSGGTADPWASVWFDWEPATAKLLSKEWLKVLVPASSSIKVATDPHVLTETHDVILRSDDGSELTAAITRERGNEMIPYWANYALQISAPCRSLAYATSSPLSFPVSPDGSDLSKVLVPGLVLDDFSDADLISEIGTEWTYRAVDPKTGTWGPTRDERGYALVLTENFSADTGTKTDEVTLDLNGLDASAYDGVYVVVKGQGSQHLVVGLDGVVSTTEVQLTGDWRGMHTTAPETHVLPFTSFRGLDTHQLRKLTLALGERVGTRSYFIYEVGFYEGLDHAVARVAPSASVGWSFVFRSNAIGHQLRMLCVDDVGRVFKYSETLEFPLHDGTEIVLDGTRILGSDKATSVVWGATNGDPSDATFGVTEANPLTASLTSEYPNVLSVTFQGELPNGTSVAKAFKAILRYRNGPPFSIRGCSIGPYYDSQISTVASLASNLDQIVALGFNWVSFCWTEFYSQEDFLTEDYHLRALSTRVYGPPTVPPSLLGQFVDLAHQKGLRVMISCCLDVEPADLRATIGQYAIRPAVGFFKPGGDEGGYFHFVLEAAQFAQLHGVDLLNIGTEFTQLVYSAARPHWQDLLGRVRAVYRGQVTYELYAGEYNYPHTDAWPWELGRYGIPYEQMDYVGADEYRPFGVTGGDSTLELYASIVNGVTDPEKHFRLQLAGDVERMSETYGKPYLVTEMGFMNADGSTCTYHPETLQVRDDEEARRAWTAYLRAMSDLVGQGSDYAGLFVWEWPNMPDAAQYTQDSWWLVNYGIKGKPALFETISAFFLNCPSHSGKD